MKLWVDKESVLLLPRHEAEKYLPSIYVEERLALGIFTEEVVVHVRPKIWNWRRN